MKKRYICKCGKIVYKSTNADTTGNRDTEHCAGCPHLLPWGPDEYVAGQGFVKNVKGYECRMSKCLEYGSRFSGNLEDKTTCSVVSLDFAFLQRISDWIAETYPDRELWGSFSPDKIRPSEYCSNGRYRMSIACAQNKKGIAAKAALLHQFFDDSGHRKDKTSEEEKAIVLAAIEEGKAQTQKKEKNIVYKDPITGELYRVSPKPLEHGCFFIEHMNPNSDDGWKPDLKAAQGHPREKSVQSRLAYLANENGWEISQADHSVDETKNADNRGIMTEAGELLPNGSECRRYALSRARLGMGKVQAIHVCDDQPDGVKIWLNASCPAEYWVLREAGKIEGEHVESCPYCAALLRIGCGDVLLVPFGKELDSNKLPKISDKPTSPACSCAGEQNCAQSGCTYVVKRRANPTPADADASPCAPTASDAPPLPSQSAVADARQGGEDDTGNPTSSAAATAAAEQTADGPERSDSADMTAVPAAENSGPLDLVDGAAAAADLPEVCRGCQCMTCGNKDCATPCWMDPKEVDECERIGVAGDDCEDYQPKEDAKCLKRPAPNGAAAASIDENAAQKPQPEETMITQTSANSSSAPACPADAGAATQSPSAAAPASLAAEPIPVFDYSGLPGKTVEVLHLAATEVLEARQIFVCRVSAAVALAHKELVANCDEQNNQHSEKTFISWCASVGLKKDAAYRLLHVDALLSGSTPEEQATLEAASPSLLYAAAKPSAPAELVQAVKDGDITTHKQYQEAMAQLKAERQAREQAEQQLADAQRANQAERESTSALLRDEQQRRQKAEEGRIAAQSKAARYAEMKDAALKTLKNEREKLRAAQSGQAQQLADAKKQWQAAADREKQAAVAAAIEQAHTDARASAAVDVLFDQLENTVAALQAALETLEEMDIDKAAKLRRSLVRLLQTLAAQMGVG